MARTDSPRYLDSSKRVRETFARYELANVLLWAFDDDDPVVAAPDDQLDEFLYRLLPRVRSVVPWSTTLGDESPAQVRSELAQAFTTIRGIAEDIAAGRATRAPQMTIEPLIPATEGDDRDGRPRVSLYGRLADGVVWMALRLFTEVPRSLIRPCRFGQCSRIYVASKNQQFCLPHQREAQRETQRRALHAFRARQRAAKQRTAKKTPRRKKTQ